LARLGRPNPLGDTRRSIAFTCSVGYASAPIDVMDVPDPRPRHRRIVRRKKEVEPLGG
jgi:hypothetical protein